MITKNKVLLVLPLILLIAVPTLHAQFILPQEDYTTQRDVDVIRTDIEKIDVRGIRVRKSSGRKGELVIAWTVTNKKDILAVVRSDRVLSTLSSLQSGKVVSLLDPGTNAFKDTILTPGEYYYAVVSYPNLKDESVILKASDNYVTSPVRFTEKDLARQQEFKDEAVSDIKAEAIDNKSIRIKWSYESVPNAFLLIYRNTSEISDESKLKASLRIGVVPSSKNYFDDNDTANGEFFYAVMVQNQAGLEKIQLKPNVTYTTSSVKKMEVLSSSVKALRATVNENDILLSWYDPEPGYTDQSIIYRSQKPILTEPDLETASIIGRVGQDISKFTDKSLRPGEYFFAVLTQNKQGTIQKQLVANENALSNPVVISDKPQEKQPEKEEIKPEVKPERKEEVKRDSRFVYDMQAIPERNRVLVSWKPEKDIFKDLDQTGLYFHLFRFAQKPSSMADLSTKNYVAKIPLNADSFYDNPPGDGFYYYAIFLTTPKGVMPSDLRFGDNLVGPVIYKRTQGTSSMKNDYAIPEHHDLDFSFYDDSSQIGAEKLNELLRRTYLQNNYQEAVKSLEDYRHSSSLHVRARANFYSAISEYNLGNYDRAMELIMEPSVRKVYKERADFWYKQILEKMTK